jgi:multiple sugar transport system substrate-binding protein/putative chitobiose transport system substrate-binding protein
MKIKTNDNINQKIFLFSIISCFLLIFLSPSFSAAAENDYKEIEFWTINLKSNYEDYFLKKINEYQLENPDIKIKWEDLSFYSIKQNLMFRMGGDIPQLVNLSPELMSSLLHEGLLYPISEFKKDYSKEFYQKLWETGRYQGEIYAFPWYLSSRIMAYNKEIFAIAGLDPANPPETYKELYDAAEVIKEKTGVYAFMPRIKIYQEFLKAGITLFEEKEGTLEPAFNTEKALEIISNYQRLAENDIIPSDSLTANFNIAVERYLENDLAILITAPQFLKRIENDSEYIRDMTGLAPLPTAEAGILNASLMNLVIPRDAEFKKETAEFAAFITNSKSQLEFSGLTGVLPSAKINTDSLDTIDRTTLNEYNKINYTSSNNNSLTENARQILMMNLDKTTDLTLLEQKSNDIIKLMDQQFARAFAGKISAEEALELMEIGCIKILNEE